MLSPIGPGVPEALRGVLKTFHDALLSMISPAAPTPLFSASQAALPPAAEHPRTVVLVSDLNILAHSDGVHWIRQDTGGVVV